MDADAAIGERARLIRRRRGLSLAVVAGLAGISKSFLSMLENGHRRFERRGLVEDLAGALGCSVADLTGQPYPPVDRDTRDALAAVPGIKEALHSYGPDDVPDVVPRPLVLLTRWAAEANEHTAQACYGLAGREIGAVLTELVAHAHTASAAQRDQATEGAVLACFTAGVVASRTGHADLAVAAAQRGVELASRAGDPAALGFARWYWGLELTSVGARDRAHAVAAAGIDVLSGSVGIGHTADTCPAEVVGLLHLQQARAAARARRADDAADHLNEAAALAERIGEHNGFGQHFGPTNVAVWRVPIGIELGEGPRAAEEATRTPVDVAALAAPSGRPRLTWTSPVPGRRTADRTTPRRSATSTPPTASRPAVPAPTRSPGSWSPRWLAAPHAGCGSWTACATGSVSTDRLRAAQRPVGDRRHGPEP